MSVTIKDVAALAGVSPSTVSRTCKDHPSISRETKEKVRRAMAELGYEPNIQTALPGQTPHLISIILPPSSKDVCENAFYLEAVRGISQFCNGREYISAIVTGKNEKEILQAVRTLAKDERMGGFILLYSKQEDHVMDYLYNEGLIYVLIGKAKQHANQTVYIDNDNLLAGKEAAEYLYQLGHRKIAYVDSEYVMYFSAERKKGYQHALLEHGLALNPEYYIKANKFSLDENKMFQNLLKSEDRPTAVVASDDILAIALERLCIRMGLCVPEDLSIVSFNNSLLARIASPQLTSIDINSYQLGMEAAAQLINHIENPNMLATKIIVPHFMVVRESCKKVNVS